jgi:hypothetical protein
MQVILFSSIAQALSSPLFGKSLTVFALIRRADGDERQPCWRPVLIPSPGRRWRNVLRMHEAGRIACVFPELVARGAGIRMLRTCPARRPMSASLIGHSGSSAFRLSTTTVSMSLTGSCFSSESAPGALPSWDSRTRWNNLSGGLAVRRTVGPSGHANSPHPSSREGHHSTARWSSSVLLLD